MNLNLNNITFVIVTYNSEQVINECLDSLPKEASKIIIENSNNIETKNYLEKKYDNIKVFLSKNDGMGSSNNKGIDKSNTQFVFIINPDTVFNTNLIGTFNVLKKCIKDNSDLIFLSSSRVYSIANLRKIKKNFNFKKKINIKEKINENFETTLPSSLYGFTKLASEKLIKEMLFNRKMKYLINRFGVVAGPWQFGKQDQGFVPLWVARHFYMKKLSYIGFGGHGNQIRDVIHVDDLCEIILKQIKNFNKIKNITFNIGGGEKNSISLKNLTLKCRKITGNEIKISRVSKTSQFDIPYYVTDNKKVEKYYGWRPKKNVDQIVKDIYQWLVKNKKLKKYFK